MLALGPVLVGPLSRDAMEIAAARREHPSVQSPAALPEVAQAV